MNPNFAPARAGWLGVALLSVSVGLNGCGGGGGNGPARPITQLTPAPTAIVQTTPAPPAPIPQRPPSQTPNSGGTGRCSTSYDPNYVGSLDPDRGNANPVLHWGVFPLRIFFKTDGFYSDARQAQAVQGFNRWVASTGSNGVTFNVVSNQSSANVVVDFYRFSTSSNGQLGITEYVYDGRTGLILTDTEAGPVTISIGITGDANTDLGTAAHEFGHALGINGHSPNAADLMFFEGNDAAGGNITTRDLNTLLTGYCGDFNKNANARLAPSNGERIRVKIQ